MAQLPGGIPIGTLGIGRHGSINAALLAAAILTICDDNVTKALDQFRDEQTATVLEIPSDDL